MEQLTPRQQQVLDCIAGHIDDNGYPPTLREIAAALKVSGTLGVIKHLQALEKKGYLEKETGSSRGLRLVGREENRRMESGLPLPVVGRVAAGALQPAIEESDEAVSVDRSQARVGDFLLRVKGDSMIEAGILDGDLAQVRPQQTAQNGEIVVVLIDDEATLKRFYREGDTIRLQPENKSMQPIIVKEDDGEVRIIGKLVGLFRTFP